MSEGHTAPAIATDHDLDPSFRAVLIAGRRRGIRLENAYWRTVEEMARKRNISTARLIEEIISIQPTAENITSLIRVQVLKWALEELTALAGNLGRGLVESLVHACPTPALALQDDRHIVAHNGAFLRYVRSSLSRLSDASAAPSLRLTLDVPIADLIATLQRSNNAPVVTGFVLTYDEQRMRGRVSTALVSVPPRPILIGYVVLA